MKKEARILVCYNSPVSIFPVYNGKPGENSHAGIDLSEYSFVSQINQIVEILSEKFQVVESFAVNRDVTSLINKLNSFQPDAIVNFVESVEGITNYEYCVAALFELLGFEFTGNTAVTLGNCLNKLRTKAILKSYGIKTPEAITIEPDESLTKSKIKLNYPLIMKLEEEDASIGISEYSVVRNFNELKNHFNFLKKTYNKKIIVEEYIVGRELNVAVLNGKVLPISEIDFTGLPENLPKIVTYDGKWIENSTYYNHTKPVCPAKLNSRIKSKIEKVALEAYRVMNCRDYARVDIRLSKENVPYVIEVNPNPDVSSDSGFARAASATGIDYSSLLETITNLALNRKRNDSINQAI
ncbi:MAG: ATP-grasp domain-containing protein [Ignavibacterium album]|uniref:D-alanine--D-alanine ligase family protein n=1 Tax=Ignavibacterium album TaxID=591197 RepID=UPI0026F15BCA|nr:ATP-grasp domain-containing protein [Ignavibacterium album]MBI5662954.1 ATP-grasp domain-containing protein [Ignavibacterium album]